MEAWLDPAEQEEAAAEAAREEALRLCGAIRVLSRHQEGRAFLVWLLRQCSVLQQDFPAESVAAGWNAGRRELGLRILSLCIQEGVAGQLLQETTGK